MVSQQRRHYPLHHTVLTSLLPHANNPHRRLARFGLAVTSRHVMAARKARMAARRTSRTGGTEGACSPAPNCASPSCRATGPCRRARRRRRNRRPAPAGAARWPWPASRALISMSFLRPSCSLGSGMPISVMSRRFRRRARQRQRRQPGRAVDAQQRQPVALSSATRSALPSPSAPRSPCSHRTTLRAVTMSPRPLTISPVPYSTRLANAANGTGAPETARRRSPSPPSPAQRWFPSSGRTGW